MLIRSFTQKLNSNLTNLNINNYLHKLTFFAILQNITLKPVQYLIRDEEVLLHQKHDSNPILADYGTDHISIRINDKDNDNIFNPLDSFSFKSVPPFQSKFKTPIKKHNKSLHQQSLLLNDTDNISGDDDHIYRRVPKDETSFTPVTTITTETFSSTTNPKSDTHSTNAIETQQPIKISSY